MPKQPLKIPRNRTAAMQLMQQLVGSGHHRYVSGHVAPSKLPRFVEKLAASFPIHRDAPGRAYDRRQRRASVHLVVCPLDDLEVFWCLLSTKGAGGLGDPDSPDIGPRRDTRLRGQHLRFAHYELLHYEKVLPKIRATTWTWRIEPKRYAEYEAAVVQTARERDLAALVSMAQRHASMPMFSGIRGQVLKLNQLLAKLAAKFNKGTLVPPQLPSLRKLPIYAGSSTGPLLRE